MSPSMGRAAEIAKKDTETAYVPRIRRLVEEDKVGAARKLVEEALLENPEEPDLAYWKEVLSPARVFGRTPVRLEDAAELAWFAAHAGEYKGRWVAVSGEELLAHASTLQELSARLKELAPKDLPLVYHIE